MADFTQQHLLGIRGLDRSDVEAVFSTAREFKDV